MGGTTSTGGAGAIVGRYLMLAVKTIAGIVLAGFGVYWLIDGIAGGNFLSLIAGVVAVGGLVTYLVYVLRRSARMARGERAQVEAKEQAGLRACPRCRADFVLATAPTEPRPWWHVAVPVAIGVLLMAGAAAVIAALWLFDLGGAKYESERANYSAKLGVVFFAGLAVVIETVRGRDRRLVRCPTCGRACGTVAAPAARGFPVQV